MRKALVLPALLLATLTLFAQKKDNGKVYLEHPAIDVVKSFTQAFVKGDSAKMAGLLASNFEGYNGLTTQAVIEGTKKPAYIRGALRWNRELDYFSISDFPGAYPDAIEYIKDNDSSEVWVQTWEVLKGVHKVSGVKFSSPFHRLYRLNKDNKIKAIINYFNESIFEELAASFSNRSNGTIYKNHDNINTVRKAVYAFENGDLEKALSFYSKTGSYYNINYELGKAFTWEETKTRRQKFLDDFEIKSIEMIGYPDYLEYEQDNGRSVLSWWNFHLIRKSDKKVIKLPMHINSDFDEEGMIVSEVIYYSMKMLEE